jgi:hypothetical protein
VEPCSPEPNAIAASSVIGSRPGVSGPSMCVPRTAKRWPMNCSGNAEWVRASQPSAGVSWRANAAVTPVAAAASARPAMSAGSFAPRSFTPSRCHSPASSSRNNATVPQASRSAASYASSAASGTTRLMVSSSVA